MICLSVNDWMTKNFLAPGFDVAVEHPDIFQRTPH